MSNTCIENPLRFNFRLLVIFVPNQLIDRRLYLIKKEFHLIGVAAVFGKHVSEKMLREDLRNEVEICYELFSSLASLLKLGLAIAWTAFIYCFLANKSFLPRCHGKIKTEKLFIILVLIRVILVTKKKQSNESKRPQRSRDDRCAVNMR